MVDLNRGCLFRVRVVQDPRVLPLTPCTSAPQLAQQHLTVGPGLSPEGLMLRPQHTNLRQSQQPDIFQPKFSQRNDKRGNPFQSVRTSATVSEWTRVCFSTHRCTCHSSQQKFHCRRSLSPGGWGGRLSRWCSGVDYGRKYTPE